VDLTPQPVAVVRERVALADLPAFSPASYASAIASYVNGAGVSEPRTIVHLPYRP
jgi:hypothetical protein